MLRFLKLVDQVAHRLRYPFNDGPDWVMRIHLVPLAVPVATAKLVDRYEDKREEENQ